MSSEITGGTLIDEKTLHGRTLFRIMRNDLHNIMESFYKKVWKRIKRSVRNLVISSSRGANHDNAFASIKSQLVATFKLGYPRQAAIDTHNRKTKVIHIKFVEDDYVLHDAQGIERGEKLRSSGTDHAKSPWCSTSTYSRSRTCKQRRRRMHMDVYLSSSPIATSK